MKISLDWSLIAANVCWFVKYLVIGLAIGVGVLGGTLLGIVVLVASFLNIADWYKGSADMGNSILYMPIWVAVPVALIGGIITLAVLGSLGKE